MADHDRPRDEEPNPFEMLFGRFAGADGQPDLQALIREVQKMMGTPGPGVGFVAPGATGPEARWTQLRDGVRKFVAAAGPDPAPTSADTDRVREAVRIADAWLDQAMAFPGTPAPVVAWSRAQWVEATFDTWRRLIDPVSEAMAEAMAASMTSRLGEDNDPEALGALGGLLGPGGLGGLEAMFAPMLRSSGAMMFTMQAGEAVGRLATSVVSTTDVGLPIDGTERAPIALLHHNVAAFGEGLNQSEQDIRLYLALRECARHRLFASASWLGPQLLALVEQYARGITIDMAGVEQAMGEIDLAAMTPESMQEMSRKLQGQLFAPKQTPEQVAVLERLETLLALVEGWVDEVVSQATARWMPNSGALAEALRRRHAAGGPIETAFKTLVGLELRPRRLRDAANLWAALRDARGVDGRDAVWNHPDLVPSAADLDDPLGFVAGDRRTPSAAGEEDLDTPTDSSDDLDAELRRLLDDAERERGDDRD